MKKMINLYLLLLSLYLSCIYLLPCAESAPSLALPNCTDMCGNVPIPYPFGIGIGCYRDEWFAVTCNSSDTPFLSKFNVGLNQVDLKKRLATLILPFVPENSNCGGNKTGGVIWTSPNFTGSTFEFSSTENEFTVSGCDKALLTYKGENMAAGCTPTCKIGDGSAVAPSISEACSISRNLDFYSIVINGRNNYTYSDNCTYAFLARKNLQAMNRHDIQQMNRVIVVVDWWPSSSAIEEGQYPRYDCLYTSYSSYAPCECGWAYEGNPFIPNGCEIVKECATCLTTCKRNDKGEVYCLFDERRTLIIGVVVLGVVVLSLCGCCYCLCCCSCSLFKFLKKRRRVKRKKAFFTNKVRLLQQQISSEGGTIQKTILFTKKELEKATNNYNKNRILGQGGQGTVYKGMLTDGKITAIKKSNVVEESQLEQFINEVAILSQINHRNIVKLLGCCLETDVPLLVYEFLSNGNLFQLIHDPNEEFQLSWQMRIQIAVEIAGALAYLHSASSTSIYHRDVKSTNILLDENFRVKLADFGISRSIHLEQTHLTTLVQGTFGYLDPEYFQSSQYTDKSDVYSFGVVLVELLTGEKAISLAKSEEDKNLASRFILYLGNMRLFDIIDPRIIQEAQEEEVIIVADLAKRCLNLNGRNRPSMKEVMMELEGIKMAHVSSSSSTLKENKKGEMSIEMKSIGNSNRQSSVAHNKTLSSQTSPLLFNTI